MVAEFKMPVPPEFDTVIVPELEIVVLVLAFRMPVPPEFDTVMVPELEMVPVP